MTSPMRSDAYDVAVIGAGIAGASVAAELATTMRVVLLEMEGTPGYHTTGRSAATFAPTYGPAPIRALTRASEGFLRKPPDGFSSGALLSPRGALFVAREDQSHALDECAADLGPDAGIEVLDAAAVRSLMPLLKEGYAAGGLLDPTCSDIDVHALHQGYLNAFRTRGGRLVTRAEVKGLSPRSENWTLDCGPDSFSSPIVVNAAGAWADLVGQMAGAEPIGLVPKRRTALTVAAPEGVEISALPLAVDIEEAFYLKPDAGRLLISPANEDPDSPSDVQPDEMDIAVCIDRIETAFELRIRRIESRWAGLRSFVADRTPVVGFSERAEGFFWLAGQGGYGIQSCPALARLAASLILGNGLPDDLMAEGVDTGALAPGRLIPPA